MKAKTVAEIGVTVLILFFIYKAVTREDVVDSLQGKVIDHQMVTATGVTADEAMGIQNGEGGDSYSAAKGEQDMTVLKAMARGEASRMMQTGDVSAYQHEADKNPLLGKLMGQ